MRTTLNLDDELLAEAARCTGLTEKTKLIHHALRTLVRLEAGRRLARLGGSSSKAKGAPRRKSREAV
jgi:Arc/MetJ family transcription regulator